MSSEIILKLLQKYFIFSFLFCFTFLHSYYAFSISYTADTSSNQFKEPTEKNKQFISKLKNNQKIHHGFHGARNFMEHYLTLPDGRSVHVFILASGFVKFVFTPVQNENADFEKNYTIESNALVSNERSYTLPSSLESPTSSKMQFLVPKNSHHAWISFENKLAIYDLSALTPETMEPQPLLQVFSTPIQSLHYIDQNNDPIVIALTSKELIQLSTPPLLNENPFPGQQLVMDSIYSFEKAYDFVFSKIMEKNNQHFILALTTTGEFYTLDLSSIETQAQVKTDDPVKNLNTNLIKIPVWTHHTVDEFFHHHQYKMKAQIHKLFPDLNSFILKFEIFQKKPTGPTFLDSIGLTSEDTLISVSTLLTSGTLVSQPYIVTNSRDEAIAIIRTSDTISTALIEPHQTKVLDTLPIQKLKKGETPVFSQLHDGNVIALVQKENEVIVLVRVPLNFNIQEENTSLSNQSFIISYPLDSEINPSPIFSIPAHFP